MSILDFDNLKIVYNADADYSKQAIKRTRRIEEICAMESGLVIILAIYMIAFMEDFVPALILSLLLIIANVIIVGRILKKVSPPYYEFISWIEQFKADEIEIGWFNDRYIVLCCTHKGWKAKALSDFLGTKRYKLEDKTKHGEPIRAIIDLTKTTIHIKIVTNYN